MSDDSLKSAYELAMERLKNRDAADGVEATKPLTPNQKKTIADLRKRAQAKLAELEILHGKDLAEARAARLCLTRYSRTCPERSRDNANRADQSPQLMR